MLLTVLFTMRHKATSDQKGVLLIPRKKVRKALPSPNDEESLGNEKGKGQAGGLYILLLSALHWRCDPLV